MAQNQRHSVGARPSGSTNFKMSPIIKHMEHKIDKREWQKLAGILKEGQSWDEPIDAGPDVLKARESLRDFVMACMEIGNSMEWGSTSKPGASWDQEEDFVNQILEDSVFRHMSEQNLAALREIIKSLFSEGAQDI